MSSEVASIVAIVLVIVLVIIFVVSFIFYVKTPAPKGCERIPKNKDACAHCSNAGCKLYEKKGSEEEKETKNEEKEL